MVPRRLFKFDEKKYWRKTVRSILAEIVDTCSLFGRGLNLAALHIVNHYRNYYLNIKFKQITCVFLF